MIKEKKRKNSSSSFGVFFQTSMCDQNSIHLNPDPYDEIPFFLGRIVILKEDRDPAFRNCYSFVKFPLTGNSRRDFIGFYLSRESVAWISNVAAEKGGIN